MCYFCQTEDILLCKSLLNREYKCLIYMFYHFKKKKRKTRDTNNAVAAIWVHFYLPVEK